MKKKYAILFVLAQVLLVVAILGVYLYSTQSDRAANDNGPAPASADGATLSAAPTTQATYRANPRRTGFYDSKAIDVFSGVKWQIDNLGNITTEPIVNGGRMYVGTGGNELVCGSTENREVVWKYRTKHPIFSTPTISENTVYFSSDAFHALDAETGKVRWTFTGAQFDSSGKNSSPLFADGSVYFASNNTLYALDALGGTIKWSFPTGESYLTPQAYDSGTLYFGGGGSLDEPGVQHYLTAVDAVTAREKWSRKLPGSIEATPVVDNGIVFATTARIIRNGGGDPRFPADDTVSGSLYALDAKTGSEIWKFDTISLLDQPPAVANGLVFLAHSVDDIEPELSRGYIRALDAKTGEEKWLVETGPVRSSVTIAGTTAYVVVLQTDSSQPKPVKLIALDALTGKERWGFAMDEMSTYHGPVFYDNVMYLASKGIYAIE